jgi:hypothetical protein
MTIALTLAVLSFVVYIIADDARYFTAKGE